MSAYYNEIDPFAAAWLRELMKANLIAPGEVDERSIEEVQPEDLKGFTQCHFFAGIGCWSYALRNAGWADDTPVWTGSCPCQGFSASGKRGGFSDQRHLWPAWFRLIRECAPHVVFGEQVASKDGLAWLDVVLSDLEGAGYTCGAADTCAAGFGAPHIRQRLYFVAQPERAALDGERRELLGSEGTCARWGSDRPGGSSQALRGLADAEGTTGQYAPKREGRANDEGCSQALRGLADAERTERRPPELRGQDADGQAGQRRQGADVTGERSQASLMADPGSPRRQRDRLQPLLRGRAGEGPDERPARPGPTGELGHADDERLQGCAIESVAPEGREVARRPLGLSGGDGELEQPAGDGRGEGRAEPAREQGRPNVAQPGLTNGFWRDAVWLWCRDGKWRPTEPGSFPLAHGSPARVGRLRGYGNAINAPQAQAFIAAYREQVSQ